MMYGDVPYQVLFLCTGNSARSIIAECLLNRDGPPRFKAYSAGSFPVGRVNPHAIDLLRRHEIDTTNLRSKSSDEFSGVAAPPLDFVFTVCDDAAAETCPIWTGQPITTHWGLPDPAAVSGPDSSVQAAFESAYDIIQERIQSLIKIPVWTLDVESLRERLSAIGQSVSRRS